MNAYQVYEHLILLPRCMYLAAGITYSLLTKYTKSVNPTLVNTEYVNMICLFQCIMLKLLNIFTTTDTLNCI